MSLPDTHPDCSLPAERTDEHFVERHAHFIRRASEGPIDLLFLGDSITRRWAEVPDLWNRFYGNWNPANFGVGSDTIQSLLWRLQDGELQGISPRAVILLIGTNNAPTNNGEEISRGIQQAARTIRQSLPMTRLLLLGIFPRGPQRPEHGTAEDPYYMDTILDANVRLSGFSGGTTFSYLDVGPRFLGPDGEIDRKLMPDRLHLVEPGYVVWADAMMPVLREMMA